MGGAGFVLIALVSAIVGTGDLWRRLLMLALVAIWGVCGWRRTWRFDRVAKVKTRGTKKCSDERRVIERCMRSARSISRRGISLWFVSLPIQVAAVSNGSFGLLVVLGIALWIVGVTFETVGDRQMEEFKSDPGSRGHIMDQGLWAWTRHPNYFGDACVWWGGIFLVSASVWPGGVLTVLSPIAMTYFLVFATGARLLERHMEQRPGYREYQQRTSYFIPRPPKARSGT